MRALLAIMVGLITVLVALGVSIFGLSGESGLEPGADLTYITAEVAGPVEAKASPALLPPPAAAGALMIRRTVEELTTEADRVVVGRVRSLQSRLTPAGTSIETDVVIDIERVLKGSAGGKFTVTIPGGQVGDLRQWEGGVPNFLVGERVLLFLLDSPTFGVGLAELWQGKYTLLGDKAVQPETGERTPLAKLERRISQALNSPVEIPSGGEVIEAPYVVWTGCAWSLASLPMAYYVNPNNPGSGGYSGSAFITLVQQSHQAWINLPDSSFTATYAGTTTRSGALSVNDGNNDVRWANLDVYGTGVLGINTCYSSGGYRVDSDTRIDNTGQTWDPDDSNGITAGTFSLQSVTEHELGHALGLGHSDYPGCDGSASTPLMCPAISPGVRKTILADDQAGAAFLYPVGTSPTPTPTPTPGTPTPTPTPPSGECVFRDDFGRGTTLTVNGADWAFSGPGFNAAGTGRLYRFGDRVFLIGRSSGALVFGSGFCPYGPGRFMALSLSPFVRYLLVDRTSGG